MQKYGAAVIPMRINSDHAMNRDILEKVSYLVGSPEVIENMGNIPSKKPFAEDVISFLSDVSRILMGDKRSRDYSDVVTFAFWIRAASIYQMKGQYGFQDGKVHLGRGVAFHIAPSNVPVIFAYSLAAGLIAGNANIVRVPSKGFPQIGVIADAIQTAVNRCEKMKPYVSLIRYERDQEINDLLSSIADLRVVWGGDTTIAQLRKSPLPPKSTEITFADRYSLAVIDADEYLSIEDKEKVAQDFYNDTYFTDQNACTSPRIVIWTGKGKEEAKAVFWKLLHDLVSEEYGFQDIQGVNKLASGYLAAVAEDGVKITPHEDNLIVRVQVEKVTRRLMNLVENSGFFFEYDCEDVMELKEICNDRKCQTIGMIGDQAWLKPLIESGVRGIDRVVPIGKTMDFDLIWDGYDLVGQMSRIIVAV